MKFYDSVCLLSLLLWAACTHAPQSPIDSVDPFIGTGYHGHTYPGATVPYGAVQLSPDTRAGNWDAAAGYHYSDTTLFGFSHTHLSGTGCTDLGDILVRPSCLSPDLSLERGYRPARFSHRDEQARPGYYAVWLPEEEIQVELTATPRVGVHRYTFHQEGAQPALFFDLAHSLDNEFIYEASLQQVSATEIAGMRRTRGWVDHQYVFFCSQVFSTHRKGYLHRPRQRFDGNNRQLARQSFASLVAIQNRQSETADSGQGGAFAA